jgi:hypothetical protein
MKKPIINGLVMEREIKVKINEILTHGFVGKQIDIPYTSNNGKSRISFDRRDIINAIFKIGKHL